MVKRTINELNLLDDFLFQAVISRGEEGAEVCRILLNTILGTNITKVRVVPQKSFLGADTMHTIKNMCVENPEMKYDDGCKKIFLYTKGQTSSQSLKEMVEYMADSNVEHVTNQDIETIHRAVSKVRQDKEVSIGYMKSWEIEAMMREEGRQEGREEGREEIIINMLKLDMSDEQICKIAGCAQSVVDEIREKMIE